MRFVHLICVTLKHTVQPREVVYNCLYTDRPGHSRAHQRWKDGILIVTDGKTCNLFLSLSQ